MTRDEDGYAPLRDYAAIGDGRTVALVAFDGSIDWLPFPSLHSAPVFAALVDSAKGGRMTLRPVAPFRASRSYIAGTNVLETRYVTDSGEVAVTDALVTGVAGRLPWGELARRIDGISGSVELEWEASPGNLFGTGSFERRSTMHGPVLGADDVNLIVVGMHHGPSVGDSATFAGRFTTAPASRHVIVLCGTDDEPVHIPDPAVVDSGIDRTIESWQTWSREFSYDGPWAREVQRSALALKLLIFSPTGAIAAAATTGLPESPTGGKNYDYRFAWVRDLAYTVGALVRFGLREETHAAVSWALDCLKSHSDDLPVFFDLTGRLPGETDELRADGWRGIGPVTAGNPAAGQVQLGIYADVLGIMRQYVEAGNILDLRTGELLRSFTDGACRAWQKKDSGMWELPHKQHYLASKIGCWRAISDACQLAEWGQIDASDDELARWRHNRDLIEQWISDKCWSEERGSYVMYPGMDALDTAVLIHAGAHFGPAARMTATIAAIRSELAVGPLVYRYSGVETEESAFVACSFWLAEAYARTGDSREASALVDALIPLANDVGLYAEMIDPADEQFWGNLPQALSHLALINAVMAINDASDDSPEESA